MKELRIEARVRNNRLWRAIHSRHRNVAEFCRETGMGPDALLGQLLNLKTHVLNRFGKYRPICLRLSEFFCCHPEFLFPVGIYDPRIPKEIAIEKSICAATLLTQKNQSVAALGFDSNVIDTERALRCLSAKDRRVIKWRFGFYGAGGETLEDVGKIIGISTERVRQIQGRAIRKMRSRRFKFR